MRSYDLHREEPARRPNLELTLFSQVPGPEGRDAVETLQRELGDLAEALDRSERKLAAIEAAEDLHAATIRPLGHVRLFCFPTGYVFAECDEPPPTAGDLVETEGETFLVERLRPSPLPEDPRRLAVLAASAATGSRRS